MNGNSQQNSNMNGIESNDEHHNNNNGHNPSIPRRPQKNINTTNINIGTNTLDNYDLAYIQHDYSDNNEYDPNYDNDQNLNNNHENNSSNPNYHPPSIPKRPNNPNAIKIILPMREQPQIPPHSNDNSTSQEENYDKEEYGEENSNNQNQNYNTPYNEGNNPNYQPPSIPKRPMLNKIIPKKQFPSNSFDEQNNNNQNNNNNNNNQNIIQNNQNNTHTAPIKKPLPTNNSKLTVTKDEPSPSSIDELENNITEEKDQYINSNNNNLHQYYVNTNIRKSFEENDERDTNQPNNNISKSTPIQSKLPTKKPSRPSSIEEDFVMVDSDPIESDQTEEDNNNSKNENIPIIPKKPHVNAIKMILPFKSIENTPPSVDNSDINSTNNNEQNPNHNSNHNHSNHQPQIPKKPPLPNKMIPKKQTSPPSSIDEQNNNDQYNIDDNVNSNNTTPKKLPSIKIIAPKQSIPSDRINNENDTVENIHNNPTGNTIQPPKKPPMPNKMITKKISPPSSKDEPNNNDLLKEEPKTEKKELISVDSLPQMQITTEEYKKKVPPKPSMKKMNSTLTPNPPSSNQNPSSSNQDISTRNSTSENSNEVSDIINSLRQYGDKFVVCLYNWSSQKENQLSFSIGSFLAVVDNANRNWWLARDVNGAKGFIPSNYVKMVNPNELSPQVGNRVSINAKLSSIDSISNTPTKQQLPQINSNTNPNSKNILVEEDNVVHSSEIENWLKSLMLPEYISNFTGRGFITVNSLRCLTSEDLDNIKINNIEHKKIILASLQNNEKMMREAIQSTMNHNNENGNEKQLSQSPKKSSGPIVPKKPNLALKLQTRPSTSVDNPTESGNEGLLSPRVNEEDSSNENPPIKALPTKKKLPEPKGPKKLPSLPSKSNLEEPKKVTYSPKKTISKLPAVKGPPKLPEAPPPIDFSSLPEDLDNEPLPSLPSPRSLPRVSNELVPPETPMERSSRVGSSTIPSNRSMDRMTIMINKKELDLERYAIQKIDMKINEIRDNIVYEVFTTEQTYVQGILILCEVYIERILEWAVLKEKKLVVDTFEPISKNLHAIYNVNNILLENLREKIVNWNNTGTLGDVFKILTPFLKIYKLYTQQYDMMMVNLAECEKIREFNDFLKSTREMPHAFNHELRSLLITPVQRIPRYKLLLQDLVKRTDENHPDIGPLTKSLDEMSIVATEINEAIRNAENTQKIIQIQQLFITFVDLVAPHRKFVKEGMMQKICRKARKERTFWLFNDMVVYGAPVIGGKFIVSEHLFLDKLRIHDIVDDVNKNLVNAYKISTDKKTFVVITENATLKKEWMETFETTLQNFKDKKKTFGLKTDKEDEFVAPEWITDEESDSCMSCPTKFTFFVRRHHCRNCGKLVCGNCSSNRMKIQTISVNQVRVCKECFTFNSK
eukprot:TRINITY_DN3094_c0_g1_i2.p1 TRINITY_DN3094_c0_g1~~TRINITY_DN3094_c0_g1_i2.p1  ORF type:complete len:1443 (+),score=516.66 TRINITY_DN3094_c0_g1_i2:125-4330(+)